VLEVEHITRTGDVQTLAFEFHEAADAITLGLILERHAKHKGAGWSFDTTIPDMAWHGLESLGGGSTGANTTRPNRRGSKHETRHASHLSEEEVEKILETLAPHRLDPSRLQFIEAIG